LEPVGNSEGYIKLIDSPWISNDQIKSWAKNCCKMHDKHEVSRTLVPETQQILLVDVVRRCLVVSTTASSYLALSYVWGDSVPFKLRLANFSDLQRPSAFTKVWQAIPQTVRDAMVLAEQLNFRYLWVDTLCIIQDAQDKSQHLEKMSSIYSNASITIVAADGEDAGYGLRGVKSCLPRVVPSTIVVPFSPHGSMAVSSPKIRPWGDKKYYSRGWTYQEYLLSSHLLIFVDNIVVWQCGDRSLKEGFETIRRDHEATGIETSRPNMYLYARLVTEYNTRILRYDSDVLWAFTGILERLTPSFPGGFVQGLPEVCFDVAMLWQPRGELCRTLPDNLGYQQPSWSWVGWRGSLDLIFWKLLDKDARRAYPFHVSSLVRWYKTSSTTAERIPIAKSFQSYSRLQAIAELENSEDRERFSSDSSGWNHTSEDYDTPRQDALEQPDTYRFQYTKRSSTVQSPELRYLWFQTCRTYLYSGHPVERKPWSSLCQCIHLVDSQGRLSGTLGLNSQKMLDSLERSYEVIAISKGHCSADVLLLELEELQEMECLLQIAKLRGLDAIQTLPAKLRSAYEHYERTGRFTPKEQYNNWQLNPCQRMLEIYECYNVLWIEWEDGIAYRKGIGRVFKEAWESMDLEPVDVLLG
jgi:hypothetical protein